MAWIILAIYTKNHTIKRSINNIGRITITIIILPSNRNGLWKIVAYNNNPDTWASGSYIRHAPSLNANSTANAKHPAISHPIVSKIMALLRTMEVFPVLAIPVPIISMNAPATIPVPIIASKLASCAVILIRTIYGGNYVNRSLLHRTGV